MNARTKALLIGFILVICTRTKATHLVGGEISYKYIGNTNYEIQIKLYRDCKTGQIGFDNPLHIGIFDNVGAFYDSLSISLLLTNPIIDSLYGGTSNYCYEEGVYIDTISLNTVAQTPYYIVYQRCCRNSYLLNITNPSNSGFTLFTVIPPQNIVVINSSLQFNSNVPFVLNIDSNFVFSSSAVDSDGDFISLSPLSSTKWCKQL